MKVDVYGGMEVGMERYVGGHIVSTTVHDVGR